MFLYKTLKRLSIKITFRPTHRDPSDDNKKEFLINSFLLSKSFFKFLKRCFLKSVLSGSFKIISSISYNFSEFFLA